MIVFAFKTCDMLCQELKSKALNPHPERPFKKHPPSSFEIQNNMGLTFPKMCKLKSDETVIFAFIVYKSKTHRNQVNKKVHQEFASMDPKKFTMPFDMKRFAMGGFKTLVSK